MGLPGPPFPSWAWALRPLQIRTLPVRAEAATVC